MPRVVSSETVTPSRLSPTERRALGRELYEVARELFTIDEEVFYKGQLEAASERSRILVHRNEEGRVVGFFTLHFLRKPIMGASAVVLRVMVGMQRAYRGNRSNVAWSLREVLSYMAAHPRTPLYGLSLVVHPTTYMMVERYIDAFWPKPGESVPPAILAVMTELADEFRWVAEDPARPLIRKTNGWSRVTEVERDYWLHSDKPAARFYTTLNPSFPEGHGVVVFARLTPAMFLRAARLLLRDRAVQAMEGVAAAGMRTRIGARLLRARELRSRLAALPLFASLDRPSLDALVARSALVALPPGQPLFPEGDAGDDLYVVARGAVYVYAGGGAAGEELVAQLGNGALLGGEAAGAGRTGTIRAAIPTTLVRLPGEVVRTLMASNTALREAVGGATRAQPRGSISVR